MVIQEIVASRSHLWSTLHSSWCIQISSNFDRFTQRVKCWTSNGHRLPERAAIMLVSSIIPVIVVFVIRICAACVIPIAFTSEIGVLTTFFNRSPNGLHCFTVVCFQRSRAFVSRGSRKRLASRKMMGGTWWTRWTRCLQTRKRLTAKVGQVRPLDRFSCEVSEKESCR